MSFQFRLGGAGTEGLSNPSSMPTPRRRSHHPGERVSRGSIATWRRFAPLGRTWLSAIFGVRCAAHASTNPTSIELEGILNIHPSMATPAIEYSATYRSGVVCKCLINWPKAVLLDDLLRQRARTDDVHPL